MSESKKLHILTTDSLLPGVLFGRSGIKAFILHMTIMVAKIIVFLKLVNLHLKKMFNNPKLDMFSLGKHMYDL